MLTTKDKILELLRENGDERKAAQADRELSEDVDTERDQRALEDLGLDLKELHQKLTGEGIPHLS